MCKERNSNRRTYLTCFFGIAVMALSLWVAGLGTANANYEDGSGDGEWLFPGEYESHQAMWMLWPTYENKAGFPSTEPMSDMIRAMSGYVHINLAVQDADEEAAVRSLLTAGGVRLDHVHFFQIEHLDIWARDMGPQFTRSRSGRLRINERRRLPQAALLVGETAASPGGGHFQAQRRDRVGG
jgi:Porphyromonas-type peptidyl-arginine deiminase